MHTIPQVPSMTRGWRKIILLMAIDFTNHCFPKLNVDNYVLYNLTLKQGAISSSDIL